MVLSIIGPKCFGEIQFGIGNLPKQEVTDTLLPAGSYQ